MNDHRVHTVVVAYNAADKLAGCLAILGGAVPATVVDNSSSSAVMGVAVRHGAAYVDAGRNLGFAAGVNLGLSRLNDDGADVLLLNPDARVTPVAVHLLSSFLARPENAHIAAVSPRLRGLEGDDQQILWPFPSPGRMWAEAVGLGALPARRTFAVAAVLLLARKALDDVGRFDERFFLYAEETDWQRRADQRGWRAAVCVDAIADHEGAGTSTDTKRRAALFHAAQETYVRKWYGSSGWWSYRAAACVGAAARAVVLTGVRRREAAQRARIYFCGPVRVAARVTE